MSLDIWLSVPPPFKAIYGQRRLWTRDVRYIDQSSIEQSSGYCKSYHPDLSFAASQSPLLGPKHRAAEQLLWMSSMTVYSIPS